MKILGKIKDEKGSPIPFANIYTSDEKGVQVGAQGTSSDKDGNFSLTFTDAQYITFSAIGYDRRVFKVPQNFNEQKFDMVLKTKSYDVPPVVVEAERIRQNETDEQRERERQKRQKKNRIWLFATLGTLAIAAGILATVIIVRKKNQ